MPAGGRTRHKINWQLECGRGSVECKANAITSPIRTRGADAKIYRDFHLFERLLGTHDQQPGRRPDHRVKRTLESVGGSLECLYWQVGSHDGYSIFEAPDSVTAEAVEQAMTKTGAFKSMETHELLTQKQLIETLHLARDAAQVYEVPGQTD
jgi:uncharacterized protein with GYD domain